jgi:hypothetical protein
MIAMRMILDCISAGLSFHAVALHCTALRCLPATKYMYRRWILHSALSPNVDMLLSARDYDKKMQELWGGPSPQFFVRALINPRDIHQQAPPSLQRAIYWCQ